MNTEALSRILRPLRQRVLLMLARGMVKAVQEEYGQTKVTVRTLNGETAENLELIQQYGVASKPPVHSDVVVIFPGGDRSLGLAIATEDLGSRPKGLGEAEVAVYGPGDVLAANETPPALPQELPAGWPMEPETPWDPNDPNSPPPPPRQRITFKNSGREVELVCDKLTIRARENLDLLSLGAVRLLGETVEIGNYREPVTIGGEVFKKLARIGDLADVRTGSSAGLWPIVQKGEGL